jgi:acetate kinase
MTKDRAAFPVLVLNCGSSSLKFGLYCICSSSPAPLLEGEVEGIGGPACRWWTRIAGEAAVSKELQVARHSDALPMIVRLLAQCGAPSPSAVGHRVVHGGPGVRDHAIIDDAVLRDLGNAAAFAPLHTPAALELIRVAGGAFSQVPQVACLDTAFHRGMPDVARLFPIAKDLRKGGIERYGFHGLSCESVVRQMGVSLPERLVIAHLGNGSSVTAVKKGQSIDTSMGLTPTGGVMMGTRSGDLDPGLLLFLIRDRKLDAEGLEVLLDRQSGLLGVSGVSSDMRRLREAMQTNADARLAVAMFAYSVRKQVAAMAAALGGIDVLVFTGGIGEHDAKTRAAICNDIGWLGVAPGAESGSHPRLAEAGAGLSKVLVVPSQENQQIALHATALVRP